MFESFIEKQNQVKNIFFSCSTEEEKYNKIIELGRTTPRLVPEHKAPENIVEGCQSTMYLRSYFEEGKVFFETESDALISSGLAVLLTMVYSGEKPEVILKCPPNYLDELHISSALTPSRTNGLYSIHLRMKQDSLKYLMQS